MSGSACEAMMDERRCGCEMLRHAQVELVVREVAAGVDDGAGVVVDDQELVGLHRGIARPAEVGEHQAAVAVGAEQFDGHGVSTARAAFQCGHSRQQRQWCD